MFAYEPTAEEDFWNEHKRMLLAEMNPQLKINLHCFINMKPLFHTVWGSLPLSLLGNFSENYY